MVVLQSSNKFAVDELTSGKETGIIQRKTACANWTSVKRMCGKHLNGAAQEMVDSPDASTNSSRGLLSLPPFKIPLAEGARVTSVVCEADKSKTDITDTSHVQTIAQAKEFMSLVEQKKLGNVAL